MPESLAKRLKAIEASHTPEQLMELGGALLRELGIVAFSYTHLPPFGVGTLQIMVPINSQDFAPDFVKLYGEKEWYRIDPFIKHAMRTSSIVKWSEVERLEGSAPELQEFFQAVASMVRGDGLSVPTYGPNNANGYFALATGIDIFEFTAETLNDIQSICNALHVRYCRWAAKQREMCGLSSREIEAMKHVVRGMKASEIAKKMEVSPHTVNTYLRRSFEKLEVTDRVSASMRFLALGYQFQ